MLPKEHLWQGIVAPAGVEVAGRRVGSESGWLLAPARPLVRYAPSCPRNGSLDEAESFDARCLGTALINCARTERLSNRRKGTLRCVGHPVFVVLISILSALPTPAEPKTGTLCVIPDPPGCCTLVTVPFDLKTLMFKVDNGNTTLWPQKKGLKIEGLDLEEKHLVIVYSGGKPLQSFRFRFTDYKETELCLLFDGYGGPDLRHPSKLCNCK
jgi:hypothetical protein